MPYIHVNQLPEASIAILKDYCRILDASVKGVKKDEPTGHRCGLCGEVSKILTSSPRLTTETSGSFKSKNIEIVEAPGSVPVCSGCREELRMWRDGPKEDKRKEDEKARAKALSAAQVPRPRASSRGRSR